MRYTQRRDARSGQRDTLAEDIRVAALEALLPEELERHSQLQRSRLDTYQKLREEVLHHAEARGYVAPKLGQVAKAREDRDDPLDVGGFGQWKVRPTFRGKGEEPRWQRRRSRNRWCKVIRTSDRAEDPRLVVGLRENSSSIEGRIAGQGHKSNRVEDNRILLERENM